MIRPRPDIEAIVRRWTDLIRAHKVQDLPWFLSQSDALVYPGTAGGAVLPGLDLDVVLPVGARGPVRRRRNPEGDGRAGGRTGPAVARRSAYGRCDPDRRRFFRHRREQGRPHRGRRQGGQVLLSDATRPMVGSGDSSFGEPSTVALKGLDGEHALYRLDLQG